MSADKNHYCPEHEYTPPHNSGFALCPKCELLGALDNNDWLAAKRAAKRIVEDVRANSKPETEEGRKLIACGVPRFVGGWGSICYQPKGHKPPHIFECEVDDDDV